MPRLTSVIKEQRTATKIRRWARVCPMCGHTRQPHAFRAYKGQRQPHAFCNSCYKAIRAQAWLVLQAQPIGVVSSEVREATRRQIFENAQKVRQKRKEVIFISKEEYATNLVAFPEKVAQAITKTAAYLGDAETMSASEAMVFIYDLLHELDPGIMERNRNKKPKGFDATNIKASH